jgi:RNase adaptor protein for sRNA GlmZ degradation
MNAATGHGTISVISFGYGHGVPPEADATFDVREHFKDPHVNPALRYLTAADTLVVEAVLNTPGIPELVESVTAVARAFRAAPRPGPVTIAVGCVGGRHRSAVIAAEAARLLDSEGIPVSLVHRDMQRPVIERCRAGAR